MTTLTKTLLAVSLTAFALGCTGFFLGLPLGAVFFGLFMISKLLEKEAALFDQEQRVQLAQADRDQPAVPRRAPVGFTEPRARSQQPTPAHSS